jgi:hypothetical protein
VRRFIEANSAVIALVVLLVLLVSLLAYASLGTNRRRIVLVAVSLLLGLGVAVAVYQGTAPTDCPKFGGLYQPARYFCVREDFLTPRYLYPAGIPLVPGGGPPTSDTIDFAGHDITPPGFLFWYPLSWIGTSLAVGLLMVSPPAFQGAQVGSPGSPLATSGRDWAVIEG